MAFCWATSFFVSKKKATESRSSKVLSNETILRSICFILDIEDVYRLQHTSSHLYQFIRNLKISYLGVNCTFAQLFEYHLNRKPRVLDLTLQIVMPKFPKTRFEVEFSPQFFTEAQGFFDGCHRKEFFHTIINLLASRGNELTQQRLKDVHIIFKYSRPLHPTKFRYIPCVASLIETGFELRAKVNDTWNLYFDMASDGSFILDMQSAKYPAIRITQKQVPQVIFEALFNV